MSFKYAASVSGIKYETVKLNNQKKFIKLFNNYFFKSLLTKWNIKTFNILFGNDNTRSLKNSGKYNFIFKWRNPSYRIHHTKY